MSTMITYKMSHGYRTYSIPCYPSILELMIPNKEEYTIHFALVYKMDGLTCLNESRASNFSSLLLLMKTQPKRIGFCR